MARASNCSLAIGPTMPGHLGDGGTNVRLSVLSTPANDRLAHRQLTVMGTKRSSHASSSRLFGQLPVTSHSPEPANAHSCSQRPLPLTSTHGAVKSQFWCNGGEPSAGGKMPACSAWCTSAACCWRPSGSWTFQPCSPRRHCAISYFSDSRLKETASLKG